MLNKKDFEGFLTHDEILNNFVFDILKEKVKIYRTHQHAKKRRYNRPSDEYNTEIYYNIAEEWLTNYANNYTDLTSEEFLSLIKRG